MDIMKHQAVRNYEEFELREKREELYELIQGEMS